MTQKRTLLIRDRELRQDYVCTFYTSRVDPDLGAAYVTSIHSNGAVAHRGGATAEEAERRAREFVQEVADVVGESGRVERSTLRGVRVHGGVQLVHGERGVPIAEDEARHLSQVALAQARAHLEGTIAPAMPAYQRRLEQWLHDTTIDWRYLLTDLAYVVAHPAEDYDPT